MQGKFLFLLFLFLSATSANGQSETLAMLEDSMYAAQQVMATSEDDDEKFAASEKFRTFLIEALNSDGCYEYPFSKLTSVGTMVSPDDKFRLFNWNVARFNETHKYFCFVLTKNAKTGIYDWFELIDQERPIDKIETRFLTAENWIGCLYYEIIPVKKSKRSTYYVLLGWDGNDKITTKKIIDALSFERNGPRFGAQVFKDEKATKKRVVLEYSSEVMVSVKYHHDMKSIIMDHLSPSDPSMTGVYAMYGPDLSFDSYRLHKGKWELKSDIDIRIERKDNKRPYNDPQRR